MSVACVCGVDHHAEEVVSGGRLLTGWSGMRERVAKAYIDLPPSIVPHYDPVKRRLSLEFTHGLSIGSVLFEITTDGRK